MAEVRNLPGYLPSVVDEEELTATAAETLELLLRLLIGRDVRDRLKKLSTDIGKRRARQGLPLDSLLRAVRMDFRFLWEALRSKLEPEELGAFSDHVVTIWDIVEFHTGHVQTAYLDELTQMRRNLELERSYLLRKLLVDGVTEPNQLAHIATALGLEGQGRFVLAVGNPNYSREFRQKIAALGGAIPVHSVDAAEVVIINETKLRGNSGDQIRSLPAGIAPPVDGLSGLAGVWPLAQRLASCVTGAGTAADFAGSWEKILGSEYDSGLSAYRKAALAGLNALSPSARELTLVTVREYFRTGSLTTTSELLFCHRNTVMKRLRQFAECTGLEPSRPEDAGTIRLVLARIWADLPLEPGSI
ncbi:PucR C-terminal helix-turn-helix domain-containing protein [Arthrobacter sp. 31Cvi3.1E]|nr:PucR C-terminal helix-turn-helix domain-containing protein [Arthrobacter sp. 31Cvi3.1E]